MTREGPAIDLAPKRELAMVNRNADLQYRPDRRQVIVDERGRVVPVTGAEQPGLEFSIGCSLPTSEFGGDHRPDSDVDVRLYLEEWTYDESGATIRWWMEQQATAFAELQERLPGRLYLGRSRMERDREADRAIEAARKLTPILVVRKVVCLWTPPKRSVTPAASGIP
jgi:hypothetical protein